MRAIKTITISILTVGLLAGSAVGVVAQGAVVVGSIDSGGDCEVTPEGAEFCTGGRFEFDDARLTGDYESTYTEVYGEGEGLEEGLIGTEDLRVTNDEGAWSGQSLCASYFVDSEEVNPGCHWVLTGEDAYEGLTAYVGFGPEGGFTRGFILEAE